MKIFPLLSLILLPLWGCVTTPKEIIRTNLNPPPVYLEKLGYYLIVLDVRIPKESVNLSLSEQRFNTNYIADELSKYLYSPEYKEGFLQWKGSSSEKKGLLWKKLRDQVDVFLGQKIKKLNQLNRYIQIKKALLGFHLNPPKQKEKQEKK